MRSQTWRRRAIIALVFVLAGAILLESWQATVHAADQGGRPTPGLWPVTLEGLLAVLVLAYWDARSAHRRHAWVVQATAWLVTGAAAWVQVLDAPATWLGWVTAGVTPIMLLVAVEFAVWLLYGATVGTALTTPQHVGPPRAEQTVASVPPRATADVQSVGRGTPPPSSVMSEASGRGPDTEAVKLSDLPVAVSSPKVTDSQRLVATPWKPPTNAIDQGLRRHREDREKFEAYIAANGLPHDEVMALAARRGWPVASGSLEAELARRNGHKEATPA